MLRCLSVTILFALALTLAGCGGAKELPPTQDTSGPKMTAQDSMKKAMQGMPPEMQKKMMQKKK